MFRKLTEHIESVEVVDTLGQHVTEGLTDDSFLPVMGLKSERQLTGSGHPTKFILFRSLVNSLQPEKEREKENHASYKTRDNLQRYFTWTFYIKTTDFKNLPLE